MKTIELEFFVREAFGGVNRYGDPANLASELVFSKAMAGGELQNAKAVLSYSIAIYNSQIGEKCSGNLREEDHEFRRQALERVFSAETYDDMIAVIYEYKEFKDKHLK